MVAHEAIDVNDRLVAGNCGFEVAQKALPVLIIPEDLSSLIAPRGNVIEGPRVFYSQRSCHTSDDHSMEMRLVLSRV